MSEKKGKYTLKLFIYLAVAILIIWSLSGLIILSLSDKGLSIGDRGTFGDMFGAVNALFSGVALAGVIFTILQQKEELELQRKELSDTRKEFERQNETLRFQRFENTFFQILNLHHTLVQRVRGVEIEVDGAAALYEIARRTLRRMEEEIKQHKHYSNPERRATRFEHLDEEVSEQSLSASTGSVYKEQQRLIGQFLSNIIASLEVIDQTPLITEQTEKQYYANIFKVQLSESELRILFYFCFGADKIRKSKGLFDKYNLFESIIDDPNIIQSKLAEMYRKIPS